MDPTSVWAHRVKNEAVLVMLEVGEAPTELHYRHCNHACRRQLLLQSRVRNEYKQAWTGAGDARGDEVGQ